MFNFFTKLRDFYYPDQRIACGILKSMDINSVTNMSYINPGYSFTLDDFVIDVGVSTLKVDGVRMFCSDRVVDRIYNKCSGIFNNDKIERENMTRKDALIHFGKK